MNAPAAAGAADTAEGFPVGVDARAKLLGMLCFLVCCVTIPPEAPMWLLFGLSVAIGLLVSARVPLRYALLRSLAVLPVVAMVALAAPFRPATGAAQILWQAGWLRVDVGDVLLIWSVSAKAYIGVLSAIFLAATTPFPAVLDGLLRLRVPPLLVMLLGFVFRYLFVIVEEARRMRRALAARGFRPRWLWQARVLGDVVGALFIRSLLRADATYLAMLARGYGGVARPENPRKLAPSDWLFLLFLPAAGLALLGGAHT